MWLIAIFSELLLGALLYGLFHLTSLYIGAYAFIALLANFIIYIWGYTYILSKTNAEDLSSDKKLSQIKNISFKLNVHSPQIFQLTDYPFDLVILVTTGKRVIIAIGRELLDSLTVKEIDHLLSHSLLINRSRIRYFQWLIIKTELLFYFLSFMKMLSWTNMLYVSMRLLINGKIDSVIMNGFKHQLAMDNQDILVKLIRKKRQLEYNDKRKAASLYMSLSLTEVRHEELMPNIT